MLKAERSRLSRYGVAVLVVAAATLLTILLHPWNARIPFTFFYPAAMIATLYGGVWAGIMASTLSAFTSAFFFLPPAYSLAIGVEGLVQVGIFELVSLAIIYLSTARERANERMRESEKRFAVAFTANPDAMSIRTLKDARYIDVNESFLRITEYERSDVVGRTTDELNILADPRDADRIKKMLKEKRQIRGFEFNFRTKSGRVRAGLMSSEIIDVAGEPHVLNVTADISERKRAEEERARLLRREQEARAEAEAANRAKDEFLAMVSHELRTPLTPILGWIQGLRSGKLSDEDIARALEVIDRNARWQVQLIEDLLDVARISTGMLRLKLNPVQLATVIEAAIDTARPSADAKAIRLQTTLDLAAGLVSGDANRLQQVVMNLLSNAIKFTPRGGQVKIRLERQNHHARVEVTDTGVGIRQEFLPHVFDAFRQADSTYSRAHGGLGLGLAIVRHLVEMHGGSIEAQSAGDNLGATFIVTLPRSDADN